MTDARRLPRWVGLATLALAWLLVGACLADRTAVLPEAPASAPATAAAGWQGPFFFIQITDPQLGMAQDNRDFKAESDHFQKAVDAVNKLRPAFVVITGDLVHSTGDGPQNKEFRRVLAQVDPVIPVHLLPGNHDVGNAPTTQSVRAYRAMFGQDWYSFDFGGCHFTALNTTIIIAPGAVKQECAQQLTWLKDDLAAAKGKYTHTIVFGHHPIFTASPQEKDGHGNFPAGLRKTYLALFHDAGVRAMFAGHSHVNADGQDGDFESVTTDATSVSQSADPPGFRIVKVYRDKLIHEYAPLDKAPEKVELGKN